MTPQHLVLDCIIYGLQSRGGISTYWSRLIECYRASKQLDVHLVLPRQSISSEFIAQRDRTSDTSREQLPAKVTRYLPCHMPIKNCDVFHTSYYRLPAKRAKRYVVTAYDFMYERYRTGLPRMVHTLQKKRSLERADVILCISDFTRRDVVQHFPHIDKRKLLVTPLASDPLVFYPDPGRIAELENCVLFIGQRSGYKRFDLAVDALKASSRDLVLGIVGPALTKDEIEFLSLRLPERWKYLGAVSAPKLRQLYSSAFALIYPSDCEGFGLPLLEAMACGCPVVSSCKASLPEVGGAAVLYANEQRSDDYASAISLLSNSEMRRSVIGQGLEQSTRFSWEKTCQETIAAYSL